MIGVLVNCHHAFTESPELFAFHDNIVSRLSLLRTHEGRRNDLCFLGDGNGSVSVIASDHPHSDACLLASEHSFRNQVLQRVLYPCYPDGN